MDDEPRDIVWSVDFCIMLNGYEIHFSELTEAEQEKILEDIKADFYSGTFLSQ
jgi:hypothetical protein